MAVNSRKLQEQTVRGAFAEARVTDNLVQDVALLGRKSLNGRVYSDRAMREARDIYPGKPLYIDHPTSRKRGDVRSVRDIAGKVLNARKVGDLVRGDIQLLSAEPGRSLVLALAEEAPELVGMSHRASGKVRTDDNGTTIVESITSVASIDIVTEPATLSSLFESVQQRVEEQKQDRLRDLAESACRAVGMEEEIVGALGTIHHEILGSPNDPAERQRRAKELMECRRRYQTRTSGRGRKPRYFGPRLMERDPDEVLDDDRTRENGSGWALPDDVLDELFGPGAF